MLTSIICISIGASLGAISRWLLGLLLNGAFPLIPLGTLAANLIGAFCIGLALNVFSEFPKIGVEWRLLVITGFLGSLTTFSTFSAEVNALLLEQKAAAAMLTVSLHVVGSLLMTFVGMFSLTFVKNLFR